MPTLTELFDWYAHNLQYALKNTDSVVLDEVLQVLHTAFVNGATVFIAGNGGSASTASHMAADFSKTTLGNRPAEIQKRLRAVALTDNVALLSAYSNDVGYAHVFGEQLRTLARPGDVFIAISASGNSSNILVALDAAKEIGLITIGLLGLGGGKAAPRVCIPVVVPSEHYGIVEDVHAIIMHVLTEQLKTIVVEIA